MSLRIFDIHAHYNDSRFEEEYPGGAEAAVEASLRAGVEKIINVGSSLKSSVESLELAHRYDFIYAAVGIHPCDAQEIQADELERSLYRVEELAKDDRVTAIGEIGYDYHYDGTDYERQKYFFDAQLEIAERLGLPVQIHSRDAMGDTLEMLSRHPDALCVLHGYSGSAETARELTKAGRYISLGGPVTYKNARHPKETAASVPDSMYFVETDCPYLPPVPHRGEINISGYLTFTCEQIAVLRGTDAETAAEQAYKNACRVFGIK